MVKLGSLLMVFLLTVPIVRDCCLPVVHTPQCHESRRIDDVTCSSNQQAIAETKTAFTGNTLLDCELRIPGDVFAAVLADSRHVADRTAGPAITTPDLCLRTGALLI